MVWSMRQNNLRSIKELLIKHHIYDCLFADLYDRVRILGVN